VPDGADAIVMVENTELLERNGKSFIRILEVVKPGADIRSIGSDIQSNQIILKKGQRIGSSEVGLLATVGCSKVSVIRAPKVAILSTGDELEDPLTNNPLPVGKIRDSNRPMLVAAIAESLPALANEIIDLGIAKDVKQDLEQTLREGLEKADVLITTGGVSMGELDLMQSLLSRLGKIHFCRVLMKPGKPLTFATAEVNGRKKLIFGLPGNPVSAMVTFYLVCLPSLRKMMGIASPNLTRVQAKLAQSLTLDPERPEYHRCHLSWETVEHGVGYLKAVSTGRQISSRLLSMQSANALALLPQKSGIIESGTVVTALLINTL